ncbi:hypothetical protein KY338_06720 [Candidatus Woesearchaeota archaeon]|nr:hypothetical protein [Candidatus Woesearchaeota archaeon]MBW3005573.1 hypothetical protein [Candidatus Woesearchaeota archaeon]
MPLLLEQYDAGTETTLLSRARDNIPIGSSLVIIVETETQALLTIKVSPSDQETMQKIVKTWTYAPERYVEPGKSMQKRGLDMIDAYHVICDGLMKLKSPVVYRKAEPDSKEGYLTDSKNLKTILETAKKEEFANVRLAGCTSAFSAAIQDIAYESVNVEFNKKPKAL